MLTVLLTMGCLLLVARLITRSASLPEPVFFGEDGFGVAEVAA